MINTRENEILETIKDSIIFLKESFGVSFLGYRKLYNNNKIFLLTPIEEFKKYSQNSLFFISPSLFTKIRLNDSMDYQIHYWSNKLNSPFCEFLYTHDLWYGISIFKKYETYTEIFAFCALRKHKEVVNFYLNNIPLFQQFIFYFKDKLHSTKYQIIPTFTLSDEYNSNLVEEDDGKKAIPAN